MAARSQHAGPETEARFPTDPVGRRAARARIAWVIGLVVGTQLVLAAALDGRRALHVRDPIYGDKARRLLALERGRPANGVLVVALGSSQTDNAFAAQQLGSLESAALGRPVEVFNFGYSGGGPVAELLVLERLLAEGVRPDFVIVEVLTAHLSKPGDAVRITPERLVPGEFELVGRYGGKASPPSRTIGDRLLHTLIDSRFVLVNRILPSWVPDDLRWSTGLDTDAYGWCALREPGPEGRQRRLEHARSDYQTRFGPDLGKPGLHWDFPGPGCRALEDLFTRLAQERIPSALVFLPEGPVFQSWYSADIRRETDDFVQRTAALHGIPVVDARGWLPDEAAFADSHHLLGPSAEQFSARFGREYLTGWLQRAAPSK